jgi:crotonobetainyl-CoA:carnitine CoA-transferase CaiB-like acyl-CoA transferase
MRAVGETERFESDPRFADGESRTQHVEALYEILAEKLATKTTQEWRELPEPLGIPVLPAHTLSRCGRPAPAGHRFFQRFEHPLRACCERWRCPANGRNAAAAAASAAAAGRAQRAGAGRGGYSPQQIREMCRRRAQVTTAPSEVEVAA